MDAGSRNVPVLKNRLTAEITVRWESIVGWVVWTTTYPACVSSQGSLIPEHGSTMPSH